MCLSLPVAAPDHDHDRRSGAKESAAVDMVTRMARIAAPRRQVLTRWQAHGFVSDSSGIPQVWIAPIEGGAPTQVTKGNDPIGRVSGHPTGIGSCSHWRRAAAMNAQIYIVHPDGTGLQRLTDGGKRRTISATGRMTPPHRDGIQSRESFRDRRCTSSIPPAASCQLISGNKGCRGWQT